MSNPTLQSWLANTQALDTVTALGGTEQFRLIQGGVSKTVTAALLATYLATSGAPLVVGGTEVQSGTDGYILYNNSGTLGQLDTTGAGSVVRATSPTLVTPALGTPSALVLTNATGLPATALIADTTTALGVGSINLGHASDTTLARVSAGVVSIEGVAILTTATGQPLDADLTSWAAITRASGFDTFAATPSSANLAALLTDETGSGANVFANTPTLVTPVIGAATGTSLTVTGTLYAYSGTAIPAGGTAGTGVKFSSTSNFGLFFGSGAPTLSAAQGSIYIRSDGTSTTGVYTNTDGSTTWATVGAATSPGGSTTQIQYNNAGSFAGDAGFTYSPTNKAITLGGATVTASAPVLDLSQTWNSGGVTFTGLKLNVTNTASAAASLLMDLQSGGTSAFSVQIPNSGISSGSPTAGLVTVQYALNSNHAGIFLKNTSNGSSAASLFRATNDTNKIFEFGVTSSLNTNGNIAYFYTDQASLDIYAGASRIARLTSAGFQISTSYGFASSVAGTTDVFLARDAANTLALRNSTSAQTFNIYNTYTDASNYEGVAFTFTSNVGIIKAIKAGTGSARDLAISPGDVKTLKLGGDGNGNVNDNNTVAIRTRNLNIGGGGNDAIITPGTGRLLINGSLGINNVSPSTTTFLAMAVGTTAKSQMNWGTTSVAPTSPVNGDMWFDGTDLKMRVGGATKTVTLV